MLISSTRSFHFSRNLSDRGIVLVPIRVSQLQGGRGQLQWRVQEGATVLLVKQERNRVHGKPKLSSGRGFLANWFIRREELCTTCSLFSQKCGVVN